MRSDDGCGADAFCGGELREDCVHCVFDELLAGHSLRGWDIDDVEICVEEEDRVRECMDNIFYQTRNNRAYLDPSFRFQGCIRTIALQDSPECDLIVEIHLSARVVRITV